MSRRIVIATVACLLIAAFAAAAQTPGAIFTTVSNGSEVNYNIYAAKTDVYLDGGPGPGAPQTAAGLNDGTYVFQVTDPSGKTLLSTDPAECRQFTVANGIITGYVTIGGCTAHVTGTDIDHGATTIQLMPYNDTPNNGGEYKAWVTLSSDYACNLAAGNVDCRAGHSVHGFIPSKSKTDNFKVAASISPELDSRFIAPDGSFIDGLGITHTDPLGGTDNKWSYLNTALDINHEAHVEAVEGGTHLIQVLNQAGCNVGLVYVAGVLQGSGPMTVSIKVTDLTPITTFIDIYCQ